MSQPVNVSALAQALLNTAREIEGPAHPIAPSISKLISEVMSCTGSVVVTGVGKSGIVGQKISSSLKSIGVRALFIDSQAAFHGDIGYLRTDDLVLAISNSGKTKELVSFVEYAKTIGCRVAGILGSSQSQASKYMDLIIDAKVKTESHDANFIPSASTSLAMACGDALVIGLAERANFGPDEFQKFHSSGSLGIELSLRVGDLMIPKKNCAVISEEQSVKEAAMEMDKKPHGIALVEGGWRVSRCHDRWRLAKGSNQFIGG